MGARVEKRFKQAGYVLIATLLFLLVITQLALGLFSNSTLETKMGQAYQDKTAAFYVAEKHLEEYEQKIIAGGKVVTAEVIDTTQCGLTFYRIIATGAHAKAQSQIQSTLVVVDESAHCSPKPTIKTGRQSWVLNY